MTRVHTWYVSCLVAAILGSIPTLGWAVTFSDQEFLSEDWTPIIHVRDDELTPGVPPGPPLSSGNMTRELAGGDPNAYFRTFIFLEPGWAINTSGIYLDETYDPSEQAISSLNFSYSVKQFSGPAGSETGVRPALLQNGRLFVGPLDLFDGNSWGPEAETGLVATNFSAADEWFTGAIIRPDFSAFGETIQFGFSLQNNNPTAFDAQAERGIDNWSVTINLAPMSDPLGDGVGANDLALWESGFGTAADALLVDGDFDRDDDVDGGDFLKWQREHGTAGALQAANVPEPGTLLLAVCGIMLFSTGAGIVERSGRDD